jgi:hypothetical protein
MANYVSAAEAGVKVGDFFYRSWGYDQTNVNYYEVVGISASGKSVKLREVCVGRVGSYEGPHDRVVPVKGQFYDHCRWCDNLIERGRDGRYVHRYHDGQRECFWPEGKLAEPMIYSKRLRCIEFNGRKDISAAFNSYSSLYKWDGAPKYQTGIGYGH